MPKMKISAVAAFAGLVAMVSGHSPAHASTTVPSSFNVTANVQPKCTISAINFDFGAYDPLNATAVTTPLTNIVTTSCVKGTAYTIALTTGGNASGTSNGMTNGTDILLYQLFQADGTTRWNGASTASVTSTGKASVTLQAIGKIAAGQDVGTGSYSDSVVANVTF